MPGAIERGCCSTRLALTRRLPGCAQIRSVRGFSQRGNIEYFGPANVPHERQEKRERIAAFRLGSWWRGILKRRRDPYYQSLLNAQRMRQQREADVRAGQTKYERTREAARLELSRAAKYFADVRAYDKHGGR